MNVENIPPQRELSTPPELSESDDSTCNAPPPTTVAAKKKEDQDAKQEAVAWSISFAPSRGKNKRATKKERQAIQGHQQQRGDGEANVADNNGLGTATTAAAAAVSSASSPPAVAPTTDDATAAAKKKKVLEVVNVDECIDEAIAVPRDLATTRDDMEARNYFDQQRWFCVSRPQYKRSCGVSSLTSVWNALYSRIGYGTLPPISQEEVMTIIGFSPPFEQIRWGPFTGNVTLMRWFHMINKKKGVSGKSFYFWKPHGTGRTIGLNDEQAETMTKQALRNPKMALIYHCRNHYMVPIGYQEQPRAPRLAMLPKLSKSEYDTSVIIGEPSRGGQPSLHVRAFADVAKDLHTESPYTYNIRHPERGVQQTARKKVGGTLHCFIGFRSDIAGEDDFGDAEEDEDEEREDDEVDGERKNDDDDEDN